MQLFSVDGFTENLLDLMTNYLKRDREHQATELHDPLLPPSGSPEDVMVKVRDIKVAKSQLILILSLFGTFIKCLPEKYSPCVPTFFFFQNI